MGFLAVWAVLGTGIIGAIIGRAYERNRWQQKLLDRNGLIPDLESRRADATRNSRDASTVDQKQLDQALDAIAIEVERIGEGQRFLTKLLADRKERAAGGTRSPMPGAVRSPIPPSA
ncbi:MAG TPA: hypothetical protein VGM67_18640 [Gemmatimonadaceae bacterium]|jgi:hypothetical protein